MGWFDDNHWAGEAYDFGFGYMCGGRGLAEEARLARHWDSDNSYDSDDVCEDHDQHIDDQELSSAEEAAKKALFEFPIEQRSRASRELGDGKYTWKRMSWAERLAHVRRHTGTKSRKSGRKTASSALASVATSSRSISSAPLASRRCSLPAAPAFSAAERKRSRPPGDFSCSYCGRVLKTASGRDSHERDVHIKRGSFGRSYERHAPRYKERGPRRYDRFKEVRFLRPGGSFEYKDVGWCLENGMVDCGVYWACTYDATPAEMDEEQDDEAKAFEAQLECSRDLDRQRAERQERAQREAQLEAWYSEQEAAAQPAREEERRLHEALASSARAATSNAAPKEVAWPARTLRFEPTQTWAGMGAIVAREVCAELRARAGFETDELLQEYQLELSPAGVIQRWRVVQVRALTDFEQACLLSE